MKEREMITQWISWKKNSEGASFSQKKLAKGAGISPTYLSNIITGIRNPGTKTLERIAGALGITMAEFYAGPDKLVLQAEDDSSISETDVSDGVNVPGTTVQNETSFQAGTVSAEDENQIAEANKQSVLSSNGDTTVSEANQSKEPEKTGLALSDTSPDKLERLFDTVGVPMADLFALPPDKSSGQPLEQPGIEVGQSPDVDEKPKLIVAGGKIPLLKNAPSEDFREWFDSKSWKNYNPLISRYGLDGTYVFAIQVTNISMAPDLQKGDVLIINPDDKFTSIEGGIGVVIHKGQFLIRKIYIHKGDYLLIPANSSFKMEVSPIDDTQIFKVALRVHIAQGKF